MLKNVKESAINDERLATVFLLTTDYTDYTVFLKKLLHFFCRCDIIFAFDTMSKNIE